MELKLKELDFPKLIEFNFDELKAEISAKADLYKNMVYTDETIKEAKMDRAKLNKFITAMEDKRKEVKKQCLEPYNQFEKQMKELVSIINEPVKLIDSQVKDYEDRQKEAKMEEITAFWNSASGVPEWLNLGKVFDEKWLNASVSIKKVQESIIERLEQINADLKTLSDLPEFSFEAIECYKETLDLNTAISRGRILADIQKRKAEAEAKEKPTTRIPEIKEKPTSQGEVKAIRFEALLTVEQAIKLKEFFEDNNITYRAI